jgi:hypothetical protein
MRLSNLHEIHAAEDPRYADEASSEKQRCNRGADADAHVGELHASIELPLSGRFREPPPTDRCWPTAAGVSGSLNGGSERSLSNLSLWRYLILAADSRRISFAGLSSRIPRNVGCRTLPSGVHSTKLISATAVGFTHRSLPLARLLQRPLVGA